jgi:cytochrome P450
MWRILHHRGHHSCINLHGEDDALTGRGIFRFTPHEPRAPWHRFQHIYGLLFYAMFSLDYVFVRDFEAFFFPKHDYLTRTKHAPREIRHPLRQQGLLPHLHARPADLLPAPARAGWCSAPSLLVHLVVGLSVSLVFQTTHTVDTTYFPAERGEFDNGVYHIFATTADYATDNPVVGWLTGGLNHHIAHHLCPFVCHTHYAPLTRIVKETAAEFGIPYRQHPTMSRAIVHHLILLKQLGTQDSSTSRTRSLILRLIILPTSTPESLQTLRNRSGQRGNTLPPTIPAVSRLRSFADSPALAGNPIPVLQSYLQEYGDTFRFYLGGIKEAIVTIDPAIIQHVLKTNWENYKKSDIQVKRMGHFLGKGLLTTHGEPWRTQRRLIQKGFDRKQLEALSAIMQDSLTDSLREFDSQIHNGPVDIYPHLMKMTFAMVARSLFGANLKDEDIDLISHTISTVQEFIVRQTLQPYLNPWFAASGELKKHDEMRANADKVLLAYIQQRRHEEPGHDLLQTLMDARYADGEGMPDSLVLSESMQLLVAGHETSSNALSWLLYLLSTHPKPSPASAQSSTRSSTASPSTTPPSPNSSSPRKSSAKPSASIRPSG